MSTPSVAFSVWIWAAFDPVLMAVAVYLGWRADQAGKVFIAAIAALGIAVLFDWLVTSAGIPWVAPMSQSGPMLLPVRSVGALVWATLAFVAHQARRQTNGKRPGN